MSWTMTHVQPTRKIWWLRMLDMKVIAIGFNISDTKKTSLTPALLDRMVNVTPCFISLQYDRGNSQNTKCGIWSGTNFVDLPNFRGMNTSDSYPYIQLDINIFTAHLGNPTEPIVDIKQFVLN
jgi:hypothetical protein